MAREELSVEERTRKRKNTIYNILLVFFGLMFFGSAGYLVHYYVTTKQSDQAFVELKDMVMSDEQIKASAITLPKEDGEEEAEEPLRFVDVDGKMVWEKFAKIYESNPDFIGWVTIPDTVVDYPVMWTPEEDEFYIHRNFEKEYSSAGTLFIDGMCDPEKPTANQIIYGHHMKAGTMFRSLLYYGKEEYYNEHKYITYDTIYGPGNYEVIAAFSSEIKSEYDSTFKYYEFFDAATEEEFDRYIQNIKALTPYPIATTADFGDELITLSTCAYHKENGRFAVVAKRVYPEK